jgi:hypothetical protein
MVERAELLVVIGVDGTVRIETRGLTGQTCLAETESLERTLGKVKRREKTREFYQQAAQAPVSTRRR